MGKEEFSSAEWKQLVNAPQLVFHLLSAADRSNIYAKRSEAKGLDDFFKEYKSRSDLVQSIIDGQGDADEEIKASVEEAQAMLGKVADLLDAKASEGEGDAVRDFLVEAGEAIAETARERALPGGSAISKKEEAALSSIKSALKATEDDKQQRRAAREAAAKEKARKVKREADAKKRAEEAKKETRQKAKAGAEAKEKAAAARRKRDAAAKEKADKKKREALAEKAKQKAALREAEEMKREAEAMKREAEAMKREAAEAKAQARAAAEAAKKEAERTYVVKPGDTLSGIAKSVYGKAGRWREIFEANKDVIKDPNLIRPGWELRIPE